ncbi:MAG TPA: hypothetical protein VJ835_03555 [Fimbriimonadaceae bacterium]|nr:hypothetical protein [Fimbriimonadaceae bacterium]
MPRKKANEFETNDQTTIEPETKPKRKSRATTPESVADAKPARKGRAKTGAAAVTPAKEVIAEAVPAPVEKPKAKRSSKAPAAAAPVGTPDVDTKEKRAPRSKKASPTSTDFSGVDDLPIPEFRPRQAPPAAKSRPAKRERAAKTDSTPTPRLEPSEFIIEGDDLPVPIWRAREGSRPQPEKTQREPSKRRRKETAEKPPLPEAEETLPEEIAPQVNFRKREKVRIAPPPKPIIPIPTDAPQIILREGLPTLVKNGRVYPPIFFFGGSSDERSANTVLEELRMASEAGVHLHSHLVDFEVDEDAVEANVEQAAYWLAKSLATDSESQVLLRIVFRAPRGWQNKFPKGRYLHEDGNLAEPSVADDEFWGVAKKCLAQFVSQVRKLPGADHVLGLHLDRGEWFFADGWGYDTSDAATEKFREWARVRYLEDEVMLAASWFDGSATFDQLQIPIYQPEGAEGDKFVRSSRKQRRYVDYHLFLSDATVQRIGDLAYAVKEASEGYFLVGASYGYTFEWSHPASGHLSLGKLLRTREIDIVAGPPSYRSREPGGSAPFPGPIDSFALNGKLYISEEDFKTSLSGGREPDDFNPVIKTPQALDSVQWRGAGAALAHGSGINWMDLWGNGWLKTSSIWDRAGRIANSLVTRMAAETTDPDVCVFIDERALAYLVDPNAFTLLVQNVRESVLRAGVNAGFYLLSDLAHREKFPAAKAYIFLNAWDIRPELRAAIKNRLQRNGKVLFWLYSAGLFDSGRESLERAREVTGIALKPQPFYSKSGTTILNRRHPLGEAFPDRAIVSGTKLEPSYFAIPEDALVLGEYSQTGLPSFVVKEFDGDSEQAWTSVFLGEPMVNPALIRALAQMAGAHIWSFTDDIVHLKPPFLTIHCTQAGPRTIALPDKWSAYSLLTRQWVQTENTNLRFQTTDGATHLFLVGPSEEIDSVLSADPGDLLKIDRLPEREENTMAGDAASFDIPMMKLNEWMEGGEADEVADEWFLRPLHVEEAVTAIAEPESRPGRRRRSRRSGERKGSEETADFRPEFGSDDDDLGISVVFRKRE